MVFHFGVQRFTVEIQWLITRKSSSTHAFTHSLDKTIIWAVRPTFKLLVLLYVGPGRYGLTETYSCRLTFAVAYTVNPLYNVGVGPQGFMMLKWICRCNDFLLFRPQDEKTQNKCAAISTWFAVSKSLISNLDKSAERRWRTIFPNQVFR